MVANAPSGGENFIESSAPHVTTDASAETAAAREAQKQVGFPVLVPTVHESSSRLSTLEPWRAYRLNNKGAVRFVYNGPSGTDYWGIEETAWENPPILSGPTLTRTVARSLRTSSISRPPAL